MKERPPPTSRERTIQRPQQLRQGIKRLERQIAELESFDPTSVRLRGAAETRAMQAAIAETLVETFGEGTPDYNRYALAAKLDNGPIYISGRPPVELVVEWIQDGKAKSLALLHQTIRNLHDELARLGCVSSECIPTPEPTPFDPTAEDEFFTADPDTKDHASDAPLASVNAHDKSEGSAEPAKDVASQGVNQLQKTSREQQQDGTESTGRSNGDVQEAAPAFENNAAFAGRTVNSTDHVRNAIKTRNGGFTDLVDGLTYFAKQQPVAFLGISFLTAYVAIRFLNAPGPPSSSPKGNDPPS